MHLLVTTLVLLVLAGCKPSTDPAITHRIDSLAHDAARLQEELANLGNESSGLGRRTHVDALRDRIDELGSDASKLRSDAPSTPEPAELVARAAALRAQCDQLLKRFPADVLGMVPTQTSPRDWLRSAPEWTNTLYRLESDCKRAVAEYGVDAGRELGWLAGVQTAHDQMVEQFRQCLRPHEAALAIVPGGVPPGRFDRPLLLWRVVWLSAEERRGGLDEHHEHLAPRWRATDPSAPFILVCVEPDLEHVGWYGGQGNTPAYRKHYNLAVFTMPEGMALGTERISGEMPPLEIEGGSIPPTPEPDLAAWVRRHVE